MVHYVLRWWLSDVEKLLRRPVFMELKAVVYVRFIVDFIIRVLEYGAEMGITECCTHRNTWFGFLVFDGVQAI